MALIKSGTLGSGRPLLAYELHAEQTGASGTSRTVKITAKFKVNGSSASWYGYACNWRARVHNSYGSWTAIKGTESWNGGQAYRSFSQTLTVDVGTTSSTAITVGLYTDSQIDNSWDGNATGSFTVGSTNTAPYFPSGSAITVRSGSSASGTVLSGIIPENTNTVYISWSSAKDNEGGTLTYALNHSINGGGYSQIDFGTDLEHSYNIGSGNEGQTIQYYVDCRDSAGLWSSKIYSGVLTKNRFTGDTLSSSSSISYDSTSLAFSYSGASNTNGNGTFTRTLSCDGITVYNPSLSSSPATVTIYKSGTVPSGCYIKFDDIKNKFANSSYKGTLTFTLTTTNAYGTTRTTSKSISVNLQTTPNAVGSCSIATDANSTAYKTVASTNNKYFIPDGSNIIRVNWTAGSGKLGEAISYELYVAYGSGSWSKVATLASGTLYYNHVVPKQTISQTIKYKVRTITGYGTYADRDTSAQTLHYYNPPSLTTGTLTRGATTCDVQVTIKSLSSIPNINTVGTWNCYNKGTTTSVSNGSLTVSQAVQTIKVTGLTDSGQYDLKVTFKDDTGFSANATVTVAIGANSPIFFVNKYGIGVNGKKATSEVAINVKGSISLDGQVTASGAGKTVTLKSPNASYAWIDTNADVGLYSNQSLYVKGEIYAGTSYNQKVYHTGNKPTKADVGLSNVHNRAFNWSWGSSTPTHVWGSQGDSTNQYVYKVSTHGDRFNCFPFIGTDGVMEVGKYIDFHGSSNSTGDFQTRLTSVSNAEFNISAETLTLAANNNTWKSLDLMRNGCLARFGIGNDGTGADANCATVETWNSGASGYTTRLEVGANKLRYIKNTGGSPAFNVWVDSGAHGGIAIGSSSTTYLKWLRGTTQLQVRNYDDNAYTQIVASAFTVSSKQEFKENIVDIEGSKALDIVMGNDIKLYNLISEREELEKINEEAEEKGIVLDEEMIRPNTKVGLILDDLTPEAGELLHPERTEGIDLYAMVSLAWKVCQEQQKSIEELKKRIEELEAK